MAYRNRRPVKLLSMIATVWLALAMAQSSGANATSFCVVCNQPVETYECVLPSEVARTDNSLARRGMRLACVQGIARAKNHGQCSIRKGVQGACLGVPILLADLVEAEALKRQAEQSGQRKTKSSEATVTQPRLKKERSQDEPRTLVELTERTIDATGEQLEKAGKSLEDAGGAATTFMRRSWECVTSLFADC